MIRSVDRIGDRYNKLTVIGISSRGKPICRCDCGVVKEVDTKVYYGYIKSCGCERRKVALKNISANRDKQGYVNNFRTSPGRINRKRQDNQSGHKGVCLQCGKWAAYISAQGQRYYLGIFDTLEKAIEAREEAENKLFAPLLKQMEEYKEASKTQSSNNQ